MHSTTTKVIYALIEFKYKMYYTMLLRVKAKKKIIKKRINVKNIR